MNRLFLLVAFLVLGKISYSQYPLTQNLGSDSTIVVSKGALQSRLIPIVVSDTNAANAQRMKSYPGAQLFTTNGNFYYRNSTATKWILVSSGSAGPVNIYNTDGTLTGNRILTGAGNSLYFDGISGLGINTPYDSLLTVDGGIHATGGLRVEKLTTSPGTKALRIDGQGVVSVADTSGGTVTSIATNNGTGITGGTITSTGTLAIDTTLISTRAWRQKGIDSVANLPRVTSVGLTMPAAFNVAGSPVTSSGTLAVTAAGLSTQYIRGDGQLANFPGGGGGGGSSVVYYFNGGTNQGTFVGNTYYEMSKTAIVGTAANFTINADGYITQFITDAGDPALLNIPAGNWNFEMYFSASSGGGSPSFYVELYKYDGTTFTLISSSSSSPEGITGGTATDLYLTALAVPATSLTLTDRLAVRVYVTHSGRTITLHTQDNTLCQVTTTFTTGITALNGLTDQVQYFATGTSGTDFNISSASATHTFNLPTASATNRGALSTTDWSTFNSKVGGSGTINRISKFTAAGTIGNSSIEDSSVVGVAMTISSFANVGIGTATPSSRLEVSGNATIKTNFASLTLDNTTSVSPVWMKINNGGGNYLIGAANNVGGSIITSTSPYALVINAESSRDVVIGTNNLERMRVDSTGSVGIGTTTIGSKFQVNGNAAIGYSASTAAPTNGLAVSGNVAIGTSTSSIPLTISTSTTQAVNVLTSASITSGFTDIFEILAANQTGGGLSFNIGKAKSTKDLGKMAYVHSADGSNSNRLSFGFFDADNLLNLTAGGNLGIGTTAPDSMLTVTQGAYFQRGVRMSGLPSAPGTKALRIDANGTLSVADTTTGGGGGGISGSGTTNYIAKFTSSTAVGDSRLFDDGTITFLGNGDVNATPSTGIFSGTGGTGTNIAGAELRIRGGASTGNAAGGIISFYTSAAGSSGTGVNAGVERMRLTNTGVGIGTTTTDNIAANTGMNLIVQGSTSGANVGWVQAISFDAATSVALYSGQTTSDNPAIVYQKDLRIGNATGTGVGSFAERVRIANGGNVGIGTTTIGSTLQVNGNAAIGYSASTAAPTNGLAIAGNVGIGNTTSAWGTAFRALQIGTGGSIYNWTGGNLGNVTISSNAYEDASLVSRYINTNGASTYLQNNGEHRWSYAASGTAGNAITYTVGMSLNSSGNLGINTTTIGSRLQVNGNAAIGYSASRAASTNGLAIAGNLNVGTGWTTQDGWIEVGTERTGNGFGYIDITTDATYTDYGLRIIRGNTGANAASSITARGTGGISIITEEAGSINFNTTNTERMRITSGGNVGIRTNNPFSQLEVNSGTGTAPTLKVYSTPSSYTANLALGIIDLGSNASGNDVPAFRITGVNENVASSATGYATFSTRASGTVTERMRITSGGDLLIGTTTSSSKVSISDELRLWDNTPTNANATTIMGYLFNGAVPSGLALERSVQDIVSLGINVPQLGTRNTSIVGGIFRLDTRTAYQEFTVLGYATGGSTEAQRIGINLQNGNTILAPAAGNVGVGISAYGTMGSKLQVNGNAAIGYSASTAAPTNGLAVAGNVGIGLSSPSTQLHIRTATVAGFSADANYDKFIVENGNSSQGANIQLVSNSTNGVSEIGFSDATRNVGLISYGHSTNNMNFSTSSTTRFTITSDGQITLTTGSNVSAIAQTGYSLTGSNAQSLLDLAGTWNTTGNPTAIKLNITNTASGASAYLMDLQVGGTTQFRVTKDGAIRTTAPTGGTADNWKFGTKVASSVVFDDNDYLEVEVGGTLYRVALVNLAEPEPEAVPASSPEDRRINLPAKTSSQRIQELENEIQELRKMVNFLMPISKK